MLKHRLLQIGKIVLFTLLFLSILIVTLPDPYQTVYTRVIVKQYDYFRGIKENKIVFLGGSSLAFGLDLDYMEELSGKRCAVFGNHGGIGLPYFMEMTKGNLRSGDIVVLENVLYASDPQDFLHFYLLFPGLGKRVELYRFIPKWKWKDALMEYPDYIKKTMTYWLKGGLHDSGVYSTEGFDERGNMTFYRGECQIPRPFTEKVAEQYNWINVSADYSEAFINCLNEYTTYCNGIGVQVYITCRPNLKDAVISSPDEIRESEEALEELLDAPLISRVSDYIYPYEYMYNSVAHCNTLGARKRTAQLYDDLLPYIYPE